MTMVNHGCNSTNTEATRGGAKNTGDQVSWDVAARRHTRTTCVASVLTKPIKPGEQLLEDYGKMVSVKEEHYIKNDKILEQWCGKDPKTRMGPKVGKDGARPHV